MQIKSLTLKKYKAFNFSGIEQLDAEFDSPISVIIGTNGSGKSALLRMLNPLPPVRTDFFTDGYRELVLIHENTEYTLISDFSNKVSPHSFIKEDKELNISGTTGVQEELVYKYLNYDNKIRDLFYLETDLCSMGKAERKNFFLLLNPTDLTSILEIHRKTVSKLKEFKNNLGHLYKRKDEIETQLLNKNNLDGMKKHKSKLESYNALLDRGLYTLQQNIDQLKKKYEIEDNIPINLDLNYYNHYLKNLKAQLHHLNNVNRLTYEEDFDNLNYLEGNVSSELDNLHLKMIDLNKEIEEYKTHLRTNNNKSISDLETELHRLEELISNLKINEELLVVDKEDLDNFKTITDKLNPVLYELTYKPYTGRILTSTDLNKITVKTDLLKQNLRNYQYLVKSLDEEISSTQNEIGKFSLTIPTDCNFSDCNLRLKYFGNKVRLENNLKEKYKKKSILDIKLSKLNNLINLLDNIYNKHLPYTNLISRIEEIWNNDFYLKNANLSYKLTHILNTNPLSLLKVVQNIIDNSKIIHLKNEYTDKKTLLEKEIQTLIKANATSQCFMEKLIMEKTNKLNDCLIRTKNCEQQLKICLSAKTKIIEFIDLKKDLADNQQAFIIKANKYIAYKTIEEYRKFSLVLQDIKNRIEEELRHIENTIKQQDNLFSRYTEEVIKQIALIESKKYKFMGIEKKLSPNSGIPHKHLITFLNGLIHNVNYFISQVFSYDFTVSKLNENTPVDFNLEITVGDVKIKDISLLSKGQKEMMNLAWTLSILLQKKMLDKYPLILDEVGGSFDPFHQLSLLEFLKSLYEKRLISQMFMVNHQAIYSDGFNNADMICLKPDDNILIDKINEHVKIDN